MCDMLSTVKAQGSISSAGIQKKKEKEVVTNTIR